MTEEAKIVKQYAVFTPVRRSFRVEMSGYNGGLLAEIYFNKTGKTMSGKHTINKQNSASFVEGLVAGRVMEASRLLDMLRGSDEVVITFEEVKS